MNVLQILLFLMVLTLWSLIAVMEVALASFGKISARLLAEEEKNPRTAFLLQLVEQREQRRIALSTGSQTCLVLIVYLLASLYFTHQRLFHLAFMETFGTLVFLIAIFHQFLPRLVATRNPDRILLRLFPLVQGFFAIALPIAELLLKALRVFEEPEMPKANSTEAANPEEIQALLDVGEEEGIIEESDGALIQSVVEFGDKLAKDSMTPRTAIVAIEDTATLEQAQDLIVAKKHSRIPVFHENVDNILGIVFVRDLLVELEKGEPHRLVKTVVRPVLFVPETKPVANLLRELQNETIKMAIVIDEFGGVAGLVTIEDLVEEIVGEIHDEDEERTDAFIRISDDKYIFSGNLPIGRVEELLNMEISDEDYSTIAGFVVSKLGRVPQSGEHLDLDGLHVDILESTSKQIRKLRVEKQQQQ
ncbi:MAG: hemolysin family protein, partial [Terriglobia bacterium]